MICEITGTRYSFKKRKIICETFVVEMAVDCICDTRFEGVQACFEHGYNECIKRGLEFIKLEIIAE